MGQIQYSGDLGRALAGSKWLFQMGVTEKSLRKGLFTEVWQFKDEVPGAGTSPHPKGAEGRGGHQSLLQGKGSCRTGAAVVKSCSKAGRRQEEPIPQPLSPPALQSSVLASHWLGRRQGKGAWEMQSIEVNLPGHRERQNWSGVGVGVDITSIEVPLIGGSRWEYHVERVHRAFQLFVPYYFLNWGWEYGY